MTLKQLQTPAICLALVAAVLLVFGQAVRHEFLNVDDNLYVFQNAQVSKGLSWDGVVWAFTRAHAANWHPLTWLSHMLDCQFYAMRPGGHHLSSVLLHAANAVLLFLVLQRMTGGFWPCAFAAALFAVHPLRVESVAWIAERKDVLSGFFFMLTLWAYVRYAKRRAGEPVGKWAGGQTVASHFLTFSLSHFRSDFLLVLFFFTLGLMSKPMLVTLPVVLLLLDYWPLRRLHSTSLTRLVVEKIPMLALAVVAAAIAIWAQSQMNTLRPAAELPVWWRVANAVVAYVTYIGQMIFPHRLAAYYPHPLGGVSLPAALAATLALTGATAAVFWGRRFAYLPVGWLWYLVMLLPVIGLVQVGEQSHADRYTYLPQIGLYLILAWGLADVSVRRPRGRRILIAGGAVVLVVVAIGAWRQTRFWRNSEVLWRRTLACTGDNWAAETFLANHLSDQGQMEEALVHYRRAAALSPATAAVRLNLGYALYHQGDLAGAQRELEAALELNPDLANARVGLGVVLYSQGKTELAIQQYRQVLARHPTNAAALSNLGVAAEGLGQLELAVTQYRSALDSNPALTDARCNLARTLLALGRATEAVPHYEQAVKASPGDVRLRGDLAEALAQTGNCDQAAAELARALTELKPGQETLAEELQNRLNQYRAGRRGSDPP